MQANLALGHRADLRDYGIGLQILKDLGLTKVRLLTNNPKKTDAFVYYGYDLLVVDQVPIIAPMVAGRQRYLDTKRDKLGHLLPPRPCCGNGSSADLACMQTDAAATSCPLAGEACPQAGPDRGTREVEP